MKTTVEWLIEQLQAPCRGIPSHIIEEAMKMEKEQMLNFADKVSLERINENIYNPFNIEEYYSETYEKR